MQGLSMAMGGAVLTAVAARSAPGRRRSLILAR